MKKIIGMFLLGASLLTGTAQEKVLQVNDVSVINYGDGRLLFRQQDTDKTPLQGEQRIIDGYRSEYILAGFKDGMFHGAYRQFRNEALIEEATYKEGRLEGVRKLYYPDGKTLQAEAVFADGKIDGVSKTYFRNGQVETEKEFKMGIEDGFDRRYDSETGKLTLDTYYKDGKPDGRWTEHLSGNRGDFTRTSGYKDGLREGEYAEIRADGRPREKGAYKAGKKEGVWTTYRDGGQPEISVTYKAGEKNGEEIRYYTDGKPEKSTYYLNGKRDGLCRDYYFDNGKVKSEFTYKAGKQEGLYKRFYEDGGLREEGRCENDTEVYRKEYYPNGKLKSVAERKGGGWTTLERYDREGNKE